MAPATKVLALGLTEEKKLVLRYVEAGAARYVLKDDSLDDLIENVRAAVDDKVFVSPEIAAAMRFLSGASSTRFRGCAACSMRKRR